MTTEGQTSDSSSSNPPEKKDYGLRKEEWQILDLLFDHPSPLVLRQIAASIQLSESHAHHYVDRLLAYRVIDTAMSWQIAGPLGFDPVGYVLTPIGRAIVVKRRDA